MPELVTVYRPTADHELAEVTQLDALIAPVTTSASPEATTPGVTTGFDVYLRYIDGWPDVVVGDTIEFRDKRYKLDATPAQWVDPRGHPVGMVIHVEEP